jgi:uncharacterized repeat protein (TIGR01451 family)
LITNKAMYHSTRFALGLILLCFLRQTSWAQQTATYDAFVPNRYYQLELQLIRSVSGFSPPVASRALGYTGLALYESVVPGMPDYQSGDGIIHGLGPNAITNPGAGPYHWPTVANNAMATIIDSLFGNASPTNKSLIRNLKDSINTVFQGQVALSIYTQSVTFGTQVANNVFTHSSTDGGHQGYASNFPSSYVPPVGPGQWEPTPPAFAPIPLQPYWGNVRPFVAENVYTPALAPILPIPFSTINTSSFYQFANEVYTVTNSLTPDQVNIANFWADGGGTVTPPGHSISILNQIARIENLNLEEAALAYSKLGMSQMDAFINCWRTKYIDNLLRPVTYIRQHIDPAWAPLINTPPFPEYTSGHSTQSGAFEMVMSGIFGPNYNFTDQTHGSLHGGARSFSGFAQAANEAAISRLYGGIHYVYSNEIGVECGNQIGKNINRLFATQLRVNAVTDAAIDVTFDKTLAELGDTVVITVNLMNQGLTRLSGLSIQNTLPASLQFVHAVPDSGSYTPSTGVWLVPSLSAGTSSTALHITAIVTESGVPYFLSEITAMNEPDIDSSPTNHALTEDDIKGACISVPMTECVPNLTLSAPAGYAGYQWFRSTDSGATYLPIGTSQQINVTQPGFYKFTVDGATLGSCGNQLCCPVIVAPICCPAPICLPIQATRN